MENLLTREMVSHEVTGLTEALDRFVMRTQVEIGVARTYPQGVYELADSTLISFIYCLTDVTGTARYVGETRNPAYCRMAYWYDRHHIVMDTPLQKWLRSLTGPPTLHVLEAVPYGSRYVERDGWRGNFEWACGKRMFDGLPEKSY